MKWPRPGRPSPDAQQALVRAELELGEARARGEVVDELHRRAHEQLVRNHFGDQITAAMGRRT